MKILVVGGGGREHAIASALSRSGGNVIYAVMSRENPGIAHLAQDICLAPETDLAQITAFSQKTGVTHAFIGPEAPLEAGVVDQLSAEGIACVGPTKAAARIETDKAFCRNLMTEHGIEGNPFYRVFHNPSEAIAFVKDHDGDLAVKPIGLTGGKGVRIMGEQVDLNGAIRYIREINGGVVLEERLQGEEFTLQAFVDGTHIVPMPLVQDHKRAFEGDTGPNTGGMGSYTMTDHMLPFVTKKDFTAAFSIMASVVAALASDGYPYKGILYGQFMNTAQGPKVIEFNARFGDPEAMNVLSLLSSDLTEAVTGITEGTLSASKISFEHAATVCKYLVPEGYPGAPVTGRPLSLGRKGDALLYYANVEERGGILYTLTSRTLAFVGKGDTLAEAERIAEEAASAVAGSVHHRRDIGTAALLNRRIAHMKELR
ncbi:phosphoribosylamine--glycine ligase [Methanoregula sp.]|uniref:phosphoribosylamine--glycine ligase n=1 Tax=Methanoregula sp. TaxID=2052170 RepID=UPI002B9B91FE|nr:phosphoribosylamine--glycine ligase [Methanoregula sp.]HVP96322.1 phosphoribosylamine--glycine ligase [Methanoregula sp.]